MKITVERLRELGFVEMPSGNWIKTTTGGNAELVEPSLVAKPEPTPKASKRIRQSSKPLMNKLESEFYCRIREKFPNYPPVRPQAKTYRLANGLTLKPDFTCSCWPAHGMLELESGPARETAWEVKGKHAWEDSLVKLKVAAKEWPEVTWWLCWKDNGTWHSQHVLP